MNTYQKRSLQAFRRVQAWLVAHPTVTAAAASNAQVVQEFDGVVSEFTNYAATQDGHDRAARGATHETKRARIELIAHQMRHVAVIAETAIPDVVKMVAALRRPVRVDTESLIAQAEAMATAATQYQTLLVQRGLTPDFVEQLRAGAQALREAVDSRGAAVAARHKAGEALHDLMKRGLRAMDALSVLVARFYRSDIPTLAEWKQVRRVTLPGARSAQTTSLGTEPTPLVPNDAPLLPNDALRALNAGSPEVNAAAA